MTTSAGSLDQGYQGDAECDPRSEGGTGTASSPTEDVRLFQGVIDVERLTEADVSLGEDEGEVEGAGGSAGRGDRTARIIDGKLYHSHRDLARPHDTNTSEMDSSGFYSDLDPRDRDAEDESVRTDLEPVQEALAGPAPHDDHTHALHDSLLDDHTHALHDSLLDDQSQGLHDSLLDDQSHALDNPSLDPPLEEGGSRPAHPEEREEEDRSSASTLRPESKDLTLSEPQEAAPSPPCLSPPPAASSEESRVSSAARSVKEGASSPAGDPALTDSGVGGEGEEEAAPARARTYDKPWLARPAPPKKKEEPRRPLPPPPPMPKKNVQSKLKAMLEAAQEAAPEEARRPRLPKKNRWDDVMTKIAEGQKEERVRPRVREVKSRLMEGVLTQAALSPQAERIRQERRERRERRERQAAAVAAAAARRAAQPRGDRKRSSASIRSNRTSRAPSLDSLPADPTRSYSRGSTPERSEASHKSSSTASGGGGSRASRDSRALSSTTTRGSLTPGDKKRQDPVIPPAPRRPRLDNIKSTIPKAGRLPPRKLTDPVKAARPGGVSVPRSGGGGPLVGHNGPAHLAPHHPPPPPATHPAHEVVRSLEAEVVARAAEAKAARAEREEATRGLEALTVLLHHLTSAYEPFSTPRLKSEVARLQCQLTETRLNLDESCAAVRRLQEVEASSTERHSKEVQQLEEQHRQALDNLTFQHKHDLDLALEKHRKDLSQFAEDQQTQREEVSRAHAAEIEQLEGEWRSKLDLQHEKHLCALQELNTQHTHQLRELDSSRRARERELEETNYRLGEEQKALKVQSKKLEETLLNDTDHRLAAVRRMCASLKSEVDSLKSVVEMKNCEIHELRGQVAEMDRLTSDLEVARDRARALQAKTEDLQAQMEKKAQQERSLVNEHRLLIETYQRESNVNKRLSLENEELAWKLRQREEIMSTSAPNSSTLDLVSRTPATPRAPTPQATPRSPRIAVRSSSTGKTSPSKCEVGRRRSRPGGEEEGGGVAPESPPPSPCVKAVVEKSNSVSFILDLNDTGFPDDSLLEVPVPASPRHRPQRTASLSAADRPRTPSHARRVALNNRANLAFTRPKEVNGRGRETTGDKVSEVNGRSVGGPTRRTASESSEGGSEVERVSPTGLAWTVPVHAPPRSPGKGNGRQNGSPSHQPRGETHHLLEDPDEDEYEESPGGTHRFMEVAGLTSSSEAASDSELSQCDLLKGGSSGSDSDSDSCDGGRPSHPAPAAHTGPWCPKEGAGEAMIPDDLLKQYGGAEPLSPPDPPLAGRGKRPARRRLPSAPSSDSDENTMPHIDADAGNNGDASWSEDVDVTSSSELHDL